MISARIPNNTKIPVFTSLDNFKRSLFQFQTKLGIILEAYCVEAEFKASFTDILFPFW